MKQKLFSLALLSLFFVFSHAPAQAAAKDSESRSKSPLEVIGDKVVDLGKIRGYGITNIPYRVRNTGSTPFEGGRLIPTCSCIKGAIDKNLIPAGAEATVIMSLDASLVHGNFRRGLWLASPESGGPRLLLTVVGHAIPLFDGLPPDTVDQQFERPAVSLTNRITLTSTETNVFLGSPLVETHGDLRFSLTVVTNKKETASYELCIVSTPLSMGRQSATITLPVIGRPSLKLLKIQFRMTTGAELRVVPKQLTLAESASVQTFRLIIGARNTVVHAAELTWEPKIEGVTISSTSGKSGSNLIVTVKISPEAAEALLHQQAPAIRFCYPKHKDAVVVLREKETD